MLETKIEIKDNFFQQLKENKYDYFLKVIQEIGDFVEIISQIYKDGACPGIGEYYSLYINIGWNEEDETDVYIVEILEPDYIRKVYYTYEELFHYLLTYYLENIHNYADMIPYIEQEFVNFTRYIDEAKEYKINLDVMNILKRDSLRNFLLKYNEKESWYNLGLINYHNIEFTYWDVNILKRFMSYLMGKNVLKEFFNSPFQNFRVHEKDYFGHINECEAEYRIEIDKNVTINYYFYSIYHYSLRYRDKKTPKEERIDTMTDEEAKNLVTERFKGSREKENVEVISKVEFLNELRIIVNAYNEIYDDKEVVEMFEQFQETYF